MDLGRACVSQTAFTVGWAGYARRWWCHFAGEPGRVVSCQGRTLAGVSVKGGSRTDRRVARVGALPCGGNHIPWWRKKRSMLSGSRTSARSFIRPPHAGHWSTVNPNVRRKSSAHERRWRWGGTCRRVGRRRRNDQRTPASCGRQHSTVNGLVLFRRRCGLSLMSPELR